MSTLTPTIATTDGRESTNLASTDNPEGSSTIRRSRLAGPTVISALVATVLTERELDVLKHLATGLSNAEIAEKLFLSEATIKTHITRILSKLGVRDRVQAVIAAFTAGVAVPGRSD